MQVNRIDSQPVKSVGRQRNHVALAKAGNDVFNTLGLWFVGMNPQNLRGQMVYLGSRISLRMCPKVLTHM
jgi:hypothetical protein